jgi:putative Mn2+ efflux pump MntP
MLSIGKEADVMPAFGGVTGQAAAVIVAIAFQAFLAAQLGLGLGARIGERWRERAEQVAGIALILLGVYLIAEQLLR